MSTEHKIGIPEIGCMLEPDTVRTTVFSAVNEQLQINNTLTLTILKRNGQPEDFLITFPWGDAPEHLTSAVRAQKITCSPLTGGWRASRRSSPQLGDYWIVSGGSQEDRLIQVELSGVTAVCEGITCLRVKNIDCQNTAVPEEEEETVHEEWEKIPFCQLPIFKKRPSLCIEVFFAEKATVKKGERASLSWKVQGAQSCVLDPGNIPVKAVGSRDFYMQKGQTFTLRAFYGNKAVSVTKRIYVIE